MKKIIALVLAMVLALSLVACGKSGISLDKSEHTFTSAGETVTLTADTKADNIAWTSSDEAVATVDANGVVTAVAPGTATITVTAGELTATCTVKCDWVNPVNLEEFYNELYNELYPVDAEGIGTGPANTDLFNPDPMFFTAEDGLAMLEMYFPGLQNIEANQMHVFYCPMSFSAYEVVLVEVVNAADLETIKGILEARIDAQINGGAWYAEAVEGWQNDSRIVTNGNYLMMAVGSDCDTFVERFNALF